MQKKRSKLALILTTVMLLLALAAGPAAPSQVVPVEDTMDGLHGLLASPFAGGGSGA